MLLLLRGESLDALKAQVVAEHGDAARIVKAESVVQGGIGGFLAKRYFEVTVEVPSPDLTRAPSASVQGEPGHAGPAGRRAIILPPRSGIAALLADTDEAEDRLADPVTLSTSSARFDQLFDELSARVSPDPEFGMPGEQSRSDDVAVGVAPAPVQTPTPPLLPQSAGDLVLLVGQRTDALRVARSLSGRFGPAAVCTGGTITIEGALTVSDRRSAAHARADGVQNGCSVFVAYGIEPGSDVTTTLRDIGADQVWVVVDAGRKHEDTRMWVQNLASTVTVQAVAAFGLATTLTPQSVQELGIPVRWADGLLLGG